MNFKELIEHEMNLTEPIILNYQWQDKDAYGMWLAQTYYMVAHSTRLVGLAGAYCNLQQNELHARFIDHAREERGHEKICIADLKNLNKKISDFPKLAQSQSLYQIQYYWIQHINPISFFGYTFGLEMLAAKFGPEVYQKVKSTHGEKASQFLRVHSEADDDHIEKAFEAIKNLSESDLQSASENLILTCQLYRQMLIEAPSVIRDHSLSSKIRTDYERTA